MNGRAQYKCRKCEKHSITDENEKGLFVLSCDKVKHPVKVLGITPNRRYSTSPSWCPYKDNPPDKEWRMKEFVKSE